MKEIINSWLEYRKAKARYSVIKKALDQREDMIRRCPTTRIANEAAEPLDDLIKQMITELK